MSEPEKIRDVPKPPPQETQREPVKSSQSHFDRVLEQARAMQQSPAIQSKLSQEEANRETKAMTRDREQGEDKGESKDRKETKSRGKTAERKDGTELATREGVVGIGQKRGQGQNGGGYKGGFGGGLAKRQTLEIAKRIVETRQGLHTVGEKSFSSRLKSMAEARLSPHQMQTLANEIIKAIRLGKDHIGASVLELDLKEHIFKGLRLRFKSIHGKVSIQFHTANSEVRGLFASEAPAIRSALEEKGVAVGEIEVK